MNFCRLPPDRLFAADARAAGLDVEAADQRLGERGDVADADPAAGGRPRAVRVSSVFCASESVGTAPRPSRSSGTKCRPARAAPARRVARDVAVEQADRARPARAGPRPRAPPSAPAGRCPRRRRCRRPRRRGPRSEIALEAGAERVFLGQREAAHRRAPPRRLAPARCCSCGGSAPIIRRDRLALVSFVGIDLAGDLAAAQHRAVVAERADLVELVRDVEDRAAFGGELAQRDEQRLHRLRRQHRGRLVEDQQLRARSSARARSRRAASRRPRACAPAAADRRRGRTRRRPSLIRCRHLGERERLVEAEPDVLGRGQRVEQAEVLVDHADAERARLRRRRDLHRARRSSGSRPRRAGPRRR